MGLKGLAGPVRQRHPSGQTTFAETDMEALGQGVPNSHGQLFQFAHPQAAVGEDEEPTLFQGLGLQQVLFKLSVLSLTERARLPIRFLGSRQAEEAGRNLKATLLNKVQKSPKGGQKMIEGITSLTVAQLRATCFKKAQN